MGERCDRKDDLFIIRFITKKNFNLNRREVLIFLPFVVGIIWMGVYPEMFLECMHTSIGNLMQHGKFVIEEIYKE
jgi:NADH:ubiquinone oxidoreductase subunit 4 (subunit M)